MPSVKLQIDWLWVMMDDLILYLKGCGSVLPQLREFFMLERGNASNNELWKANNLNSKKFPSIGTNF